MMDLNFLENLKKEIPGFSFTISDDTKRIDGDWHSRWTYSIRDSNGKTLFESDWDGFVTLSEAISSLSKVLDYYKFGHL